ncbi:MAG: porin family protein, partial [Gillisia sp.]
MKKYLAVIGLMLYCFSGNAQFFSKDPIINNSNIDNKRWSYGYFLGFNTYDFKFKYKDYNPNPSTGKDFNIYPTIGFNVGLVGDLKLSKNFDLRLEPGVSFNRRTLQLFKADQNTIRDINSTYVHVPLLLKFSADRLNNLRPFVVGGLSTSLNLSSNENNPDDNSAG